MRAGYWENVFRTNSQSSYVAGKLQQFEKTGVVAYQLMVIEDSRTTPICRNLLRNAYRGGGDYGLTLPVDHDFWKTYGFPPYHYQCRTSIRGIWKSQVKDEKLDTVTIRELKKFKPSAGFGGNPLEKESWWKMTEGMIERAEKYGILGEVVTQAHSLGLQSYFPELLTGYKTEYVGKNNGFVQVANNWEVSEDELISAKRLADEGHQIYLLPRTYKTNSPDMLIDNEIGEMKHINTIKHDTIRKHILKSGEKQGASIVYISIKSDKQRTRVLKIIREEIKQIPLRKLLLDYRGTIETFEREYFK